MLAGLRSLIHAYCIVLLMFCQRCSEMLSNDHLPLSMSMSLPSSVDALSALSGKGYEMGNTHWVCLGGMGSYRPPYGMVAPPPSAYHGLVL